MRDLVVVAPAVLVRLAGTAGLPSIVFFSFPA